MVKVARKRFTCVNPKCRKSFPDPIFIQNFSSEKPAFYYGCSYCLAETRVDQPSGCTHYFGYLSDRSKLDEIPEDCMTCEKTIECMLYELMKSDTAVKEIRKWYC
jgi:hypothetical protein